MRSRTWRKLGLITVFLVGLSWLFLRSVRETMSEPYDIDAATLSGWSLVLADPAQPTVALLALRPPTQMPAELFQQIFRRTMESLTTPGVPAMPTVLRAEYLTSLRSVLSPAEILDVARQTGLEQARLGPLCIGLKREPQGGRSRQLFFALFEAPAFDRFRNELARLYAERGGTSPFDPAALRPILPLASSDSDFTRWWPLEVDQENDCRAPLTQRPVPATPQGRHAAYPRSRAGD